jgi:cytochrome c553
VGAFPKLAGQSSAYLSSSLAAYARGERHSGLMEPLAAGLNPAELRALADYYAAQPGSAAAPSTTPAIERGAAIAQNGVLANRLPACAACHGPSNQSRNPNYPELAGQYANYLELQLKLFKQERRGGTAYAHLMRQVTEQMTEEQMHDVALYYASLASAAAQGHEK